ncbi:MAG: hypothetical protein FOGNACKC_00716 [Anaerolineae bacterium]|nr:hypothetical protein [Anaerolineae bacterium]
MTRNNDRFWAWFDMARNETPVRAIEEWAKAKRGLIGNPRSQRRQPSYKVCEAIAVGLDLPLREVLVEADLLDDVANLDAQAESLLSNFKRLDETDREAVVTIVAAIRAYRSGDKNDGEAVRVTAPVKEGTK